MCTCRGDLPDRSGYVITDALHAMVEVWQGGKIWVMRYGAITVKKRPIFGSSRKIYPENFRLGLLSGFRHEMLWGRYPLILVVPLQKLVTLEIASASRFYRADIRASRVRGQALYKFAH